VIRERVFKRGVYRLRERLRRIAVEVRDDFTYALNYAPDTGIMGLV